MTHRFRSKDPRRVEGGDVYTDFWLEEDSDGSVRLVARSAGHSGCCSVLRLRPGKMVVLSADLPEDLGLRLDHAGRIEIAKLVSGAVL